MPELFFNSEIGSAQSIDDAVKALVQTSDSYLKIVKHATHMYKDSADALSICLVRDEHGFSHSFKNCIHSMPKPDREKVMQVVTGLSKGTVIGDKEMSCVEEWVVDQIEAHSPVMEYAVKKHGMLLTVAVTDVWKHDFFTFLQHTKRALPNIWGQNDLSFIEQWLEEWYKNNSSSHEEFKRRCDDVTLCKKALPEKEFSNKDWESIIAHFIRARERDYEDDEKLVKNYSSHVTKYGMLYELRLHSEGIRVFFTLAEQKPLVGGYYRYGKGEDKVRAQMAANAVTRINTHG